MSFPINIIYVTNTNDADEGSFRNAIEIANTNKLETMFKDVVNSKILNSEFKEKYSHSSIDFEVSVYTAGHWPF